MSTLTHRENLGPFTDVLDWLEAPWTMLRPGASHPMRVEDYVKDGTYVMRAELPGVDPEKDIDVTVSKGVLTISAHRQEETEGKHRVAGHRAPMPAHHDHDPMRMGGDLRADRSQQQAGQTAAATGAQHHHLGASAHLAQCAGW